jgi:hypothetical protein
MLDDAHEALSGQGPLDRPFAHRQEEFDKVERINVLLVVGANLLRVSKILLHCVRIHRVIR